jgi:hypothetical protein
MGDDPLSPAKMRMTRRRGKHCATVAHRDRAAQHRARRRQGPGAGGRMMRKFLLGAAVLAMAASPAVAQRAGTYGVEGQGADGSRYEGTATLAPSGQNTWRVTWRVAGDTAQGVGILIPQGPLLVVGYSMAGETGVAVYAVQADGRLLGTWTQGQAGGIGTEVMTPGGGGGSGGAPRK